MVILVAVGAVMVLAAATTYMVWPSSAALPVGPSTEDAFGGPAIDVTDVTPSASAATTAVPTSAPAATPTPRVTKPPVAPPPVRGGKPGAANTGVPAGTALTVVNGNQTYSTANQVISGLDIRGMVQIRAKNVTIKNSIIRGAPNPPCNSALINVASGSATIQDTEIAGEHPGPCLDGVWAENTTLTRVHIHGTVDGVKAGDNVTMQDSYVHDMSYFASDPNQGGGPTHNDAVQSFAGNQHITLRHNTMSPGARGNAALQVTQDGDGLVSDMIVDSNWVDGGGCTLNFAHKRAPMTGISVTNNRFGRGSKFNCPILVSTQTTLNQLSGNVWDDTGQPIPAPQRHD